MRLSEFDYTLPEELIAQVPLLQRDTSRLLVVDRQKRVIEHRGFPDLLDYINEDDVMVFNNTRVVAVRLHGRKETGGGVEVLLMRRDAPGVWRGMVKPGRRVQVGTRLLFDRGLQAEVVQRTEDGGRVLRFSAESCADELIGLVGETPLPPYVHRRLEDKQRYQTVYASSDGSAAAPTAGLHFTPELLERIKAKGIRMAFVTLHVGIATFRPVRTVNINDHEMHTETFEISAESAEVINSAKGRIISVGTTTVRALETAALGKHKVCPMCGETRLYITPPYDFKVVDGLVTNFHMPKSTLLILVSAFAGVELVKLAYREAVRERYRFLSFGDAMFLF